VEEDKYLRIDKSILVSSNYTSLVLKELTQPKPNWKSIRQIIADSNVNDYDELFKALYENSSIYADGKEGLVTIIIEEYQYHANFRIDKEINALAMIAKYFKCYELSDYRC
jgi:hypothetical protein